MSLLLLLPPLLSPLPLLLWYPSLASLSFHIGTTLFSVAAARPFLP